MRNILYIVPSDFFSLKSKGVDNLILERDEGGYFQKVYTLHPFTKFNQEISITTNNVIVEYGWKNRFFAAFPIRLQKFFGSMIIFIKLSLIFPFKMKGYNISVIRATDPYLTGLLGSYYAKLFKIPLVVSIHSDYDKRYTLDGSRGSFTLFGSRFLAKRLEYFIYRNSDKILPIRAYMKHNLEDLNMVTPNKIEVFPHGISFKDFDETPFLDVYERFHLPKDTKIVSFVGRFSKENYIDELLEIASQVTALRDDVVFLFAGGGNEYNRLKDIVNNSNICFAGFQEKAIVVNIRRQSMVSLCLMGGFSLIEACAAGRPVIAYDIEWHYELVRDNETGFLIKEHDTAAVVNKINDLLDNQELSDAMGRRARELSYANHELKNTTKVKVKIYNELLNG